VHNAQAPVWWGQIVDEETVWPLFLREVAPAIQTVGDAIEDDDGDGVPEVNRRDEIIAVDHALRESLQGGRFAEPRPVLVKGTHAHWAAQGRVEERADHPQATPLRIPIAHVVRGPQEALGARSCTECHSLDSYLFNGRRITNPYNDRGKLNDRSMRRWLGLSSSRLRLGAFREGVLKPYGLLLIPLTVLACLLHYVIYGPKRVRGDTPGDEVARFGRFERIVHLLQLAAFLVLAVTGVGFILSAQWRGGIPYLWRTATAELLHQGVGYVFLLASVLLAVRWAPAAIFRPYDAQWFRVMGGYLWLKGKAPAGKFNAGQKLLFWLLVVASLVLGATGILMGLRPASLEYWMGHIYTLHGLVAVLIIPAILGHVYLGTVCNPGTLRSIFEGKVTRAWAAKHHPNWLEETGDAPPEAGGK
jgi:formate dehydrogenase subunit gamma